MRKIRIFIIITQMIAGIMTIVLGVLAFNEKIDLLIAMGALVVCIILMSVNLYFSIVDIKREK